MTKQEQNNIIKKVWTEHLKRKDEIPETLAEGYSNWLRQVIKKASTLLNVGSNSEKNMQESDDQGNVPHTKQSEGDTNPEQMEAQ